MQRYSMTFAGIGVMVIGTFLGQYLSESCATEVIEKLMVYAPVLIGAVIGLFGRHRAGGVNMLGVKTV